MNVVLAGFMGTGKTAVGRELARLLGRRFVDLDDEISTAAGISIPEIFAREGEDGFRRREREAVAALAGCENLVVAAGGGALLDPVNRERLQREGCLCRLTATVDELVQRLSTNGDRPLLAGATDLHARITELLAERETVYAGCNLELDTTGRKPEAAAARLAALLNLPLDVTQIPVPGAEGHPALAANERTTSRVVVGRGAACRLGRELRRCGVNGRVVVALPEIVRELYLPRLAASLDEADFPWEAITVRDGDREKTFEQVEELVDRLADLGADRDTCLVAAGGGVTGDLVGFAASVYMRGIALAMVPTTLLAQVDASIGGKTGVNGRRSKNLAGAFHPPLLVLSDPCLLMSLPDRELAGGYAEVVKTAILGDPELFERLESELEPGEHDPRRGPDLLEACVTACARVKGGVVGRDPWELGERRLLNLGHTLGHALEVQSQFGLSHGEAVSLGLVAALQLAVARGAASPSLLDRTRRLLQSCGLPTTPPDFDPADLRARLRLDKKNRDGRLRFVLPRDLGNVIVVYDVEPEEALAALTKEQQCASS